MLKLRDHLVSYVLAAVTLSKELLLFAEEHQLTAIPPQPGVARKKKEMVFRPNLS